MFEQHSSYAILEHAFFWLSESSRDYPPHTHTLFCLVAVMLVIADETCNTVTVSLSS